MRNTTPAAIILTMLFCGALTTNAAEPTGQRDRNARLLERFGDEGIDADGDGIVSRDEARAFFQDKGIGRGHGRRGGFGRHDRGSGHGPRDGRGPLRALWRLEQLDADTPPEQFDLNRVPQADTDGDGVLSDAEWQAFAAAAKDKLIAQIAERHPEIDMDDDGVISDAELASFRETQRAAATTRIMERSPDADTDGDGTLSDEEFKAFHLKRWQERAARILERHPEADLDGDGVLSRDEVREIRGKRGGRHGRCGERGANARCKLPAANDVPVAD